MTDVSNVLLVLIAIILFLIGNKIRASIKSPKPTRIKHKQLRISPFKGMFLTKEVMEYIVQKDVSPQRLPSDSQQWHEQQIQTIPDIEMQSHISFRSEHSCCEVNSVNNLLKQQEYDQEKPDKIHLKLRSENQNHNSSSSAQPGTNMSSTASSL